MADSTLQNVEGAGVLSALADLFFKGMDKALSNIAEYEEEMGVLKQVNRIPIETLDGTKSYTLTVKLSPVRGKDNFYFVEAETDAPGLSVDKINNKTMKIDNTNIAQFRKLIDKLISDSNFVAEMDRSDETGDAEVVGEPSEGEDNASEEGEITAEGDLGNLIELALEWFEDKAIVASTADDELVELHPEFNSNPSIDDCELYITVTDADGKDVDAKELSDPQIDLFNDADNLVNEKEFLRRVKDKIDEFAKLNRFNNVQHAIRNSTSVAATFIKDAEGIGLTAVRASDDLSKTMEIVYGVMDSDEFANSLNDGEEVSFIIEEGDEDYDIQQTESLDAASCLRCYADAYKTASKFYITLKTLQLMIGVKIWNSDNFFNDLTQAAVELENKLAMWVSDTCDLLPILQDPFALVPSFESFRDYSDNSDIPEVKEALAREAMLTVQICNFISVDFDAEQQAEIEMICNRIEAILADK